jgi:ATP-dependent DNA helicase RecG
MKLQKQALQRIFFDRLLRVQLHSLLQKEEYEQKSLKRVDESDPRREIIKEFIEKLPFTLTNAQKKVIKHCIESIHDKKPMMALLQWDVGSWKTIVAATIAYYMYKFKNKQSIFIAPLEVLANQHHKTLAKLMLPLWIRSELLTWSTPKAQKEKIKQDIQENRIPIIIWTHALLQEDVSFTNLWFVVIDEQHKFWVRQRAAFKKHGNPDILQMSATPIPRSMALAFFGEFDVHIIDELPKGRQAISTKIISESEYIKLKPRILSKIAENQKVFVITPLIEESEKLEEVKAATSEYKNIQELFPELKWRIALIHGKMNAKEKDETMMKFKQGNYCLLVSTTVIEVGVDIPEATIMIIKNAERFWLSQLHQLRGRIGRSDLKSYCFLETRKKTGESYKRMQAMEETNDWFKLAELDLKNRWPWEILWTIQSWETDIPIDILSDLKFIERVQEWAKRLLEKYPKLEGLTRLKKYLEEKTGDILA